ncbi:hypothetical protein MMC13_004972 [Lambiella insularis]|nr:hypothetical protein [Lambiella insularis]
MLASTASPLHAHIKFKVLGLIAICPKASLSSQEQVIRFRRFLHVPTLIFDLWRKWDRRGGPNSASVTRFVPENADIETKKLQQKFNESSRTAVWRRMAWGALPDFDANGEMVGGLPGPDIWAGLSLALLLVAGEADNVTKPEEIALICKAVRRTGKENEADYSTLQPEEAIPQATAPLWKSSPQVDKAASSHDDKYGLEKSTTKICETGGDSAITSMDSYAVPMLKHKPIVKATILPSPATHALLYDHATYRTLAGLIQTFLCDHIDSRLSLGWQLQYLCTEGKWDVKNLAKWQAVTPVSEPIAGVFRAMKTLREIDGVHSPAVFVKDWKDKIKAVVDISHESPVYDSQGLESGGIEYHKFPTVSKIPPTTDEVKDFITLVDRLRLSSQATDHVRLIGVHCHYGYNRTGFFICAYLIEKEGFSVQGAIDAFQKGRPPGIRHEHFIDTLFVRYCMGLKRDPTI